MVRLWMGLWWEYCRIMMGLQQDHGRIIVGSLQDHGWITIVSYDQTFDHGDYRGGIKPLIMVGSDL